MKRESQTPAPIGNGWAEVVEEVGPVKIAKKLLQAGMKAAKGK